MDSKSLSQSESLALITEMINRAKNSYHDSGIGPIMWGSVITICSIATFIQIHFKVELGFDIWLLTLFAIVPQVWLVRKEKKLRKVRSHNDVILDAVWTCFGISIFLLIFINGNIVHQLRPVFEHYVTTTGSRPAYNYSSFSASFFLMLYGIPTVITGVSYNFKPMLAGGIICWICCMVSVYTKIEADMLLTAFAAIAAWLIPGIILFRKNQQRKKGIDV